MYPAIKLWGYTGLGSKASNSNCEALLRFAWDEASGASTNDSFGLLKAPVQF